MIWAIDFDGVISANWPHYTQLAEDLMKNHHIVYVVTACNWKRIGEVKKALERHGFPYTQLITRPAIFNSSLLNIGMWKQEQAIKYNFDIWFDNEFKDYKLAGVKFLKVKATMVQI
jgi:hypothetical protein